MSIERIAKIAGVSKATVSRAINTPSIVKPETVERVNQAIEEIAYKPRIKKTLSINIYFNKLTIIIHSSVLQPHSFYFTIYEFLKKEADKLGLSVDTIIVNSDSEITSIASKIKHSEAIIIAGINSNELNDVLHSLKTPSVLINCFDDLMRLSSISPDYELGGFLIGQNLIQNGYKKTKILTTIPRLTIQQRVDGFSRAMKIHEQDFDQAKDIIDIRDYADPQILTLMNNDTAGQDLGSSFVMDKIVDSGILHDCDAVFCICDLMAIALIQSLKSKNIAVPKDIAIVGFDDLDISSLITPALSTVRPEYSNLAKSAIYKLARLSNDPQEPMVRSYTAVNFIERLSTYQ
ncbi:LacI family transcriptional regulator [Vibrio sp. SS-MA-C1-2]|uniref:LacI family DNA-binding transcriptional regulator n=1 Tax=Vibrio sp. SS-MA-C1-2 TaxID=2908646 RepID=UPI001F301102|nr:LacI family DNA-binding transcriptional regulator [Vibrio sp. SS-MA-C1-2]UJF17624.1 LacI family transcriptional regulator [Vibrio sp. SS-MA-C1-2]